MCGRLTRDQDPDEDPGDNWRLTTLTPDQLELFRPSYNVAPSQIVPVIVEDAQGRRQAFPMRWGLRPWRSTADAGAIAPINARAETLFSKPLFRGLTAARRCLVPASGYYEWRVDAGRKQPYYLTAADGEMWGLAGLFDLTHDRGGQMVGSFAIITTAAAPEIAAIHDRMPVIVPPQHEDAWLSAALTEPDAIARYLRPYPAARMRWHPVSTVVNSPRHDGPHLIAPVIATPEPAPVQTELFSLVG